MLDSNYDFNSKPSVDGNRFQLPGGGGKILPLFGIQNQQQPQNAALPTMQHVSNPVYDQLDIGNGCSNNLSFSHSSGSFGIQSTQFNSAGTVRFGNTQQPTTFTEAPSSLGMFSSAAQSMCNPPVALPLLSPFATQAPTMCMSSPHASTSIGQLAGASLTFNPNHQFNGQQNVGVNRFPNPIQSESADGSTSLLSMESPPTMLLTSNRFILSKSLRNFTVDEVKSIPKVILPRTDPAACRQMHLTRTYMAGSIPEIPPS